MGCTSERTVESGKIKNAGYPVCRLTIPLTTEVYALAPLNNDRLVLGAKNELLLYEGGSKSIITISKEHKGRINVLIRLSNGNVASGGQDNAIKIWDIDKNQSISTLKGHTSIIWEIRELEGNKIISGADDNKSKIWV